MIELVRLTDGIKINQSKLENATKSSENKDDFSLTLNSAINYKEGKNIKKTELDCIFEKASEKYNVPINLIKAVAKTESEFTVDAVSSSGAQGVMQLMPATADYLGVEDAFDPEQNIMGGTKLLSQLLEQYDGDLDLTLAAYNAGSGNVAKYGGIPPFKETQNYLVKVKKYLGEEINLGLDNTNNSSNITVTEKRLNSSIIPDSVEEVEKDGEYSKLIEAIKEQMEWEAVEKQLKVTPSIFKNDK